MTKQINFSHPFFEEVAHFPKLVSTSLKAEQLIRNKQAAGNLLVITDTQSGGIGRNKKNWASPAGGLWFTAAVYGLSVSSKLTIFTGIVLHQALISIYPQLKDHLKIKWPNDIYLKDRKLAGILSSHLPRHKYHLIGIGLNSNFDSFEQTPENNPITLKEYFKEDVDNHKILTTFFDKLANSLPEIIEGDLNIVYYNQFSFLKGKTVTLDTDFDMYQGKVIGISRDGALLLEIKPGMIQPFLAGSVIDY